MKELIAAQKLIADAEKEALCQAISKLETLGTTLREISLLGSLQRPMGPAGSVYPTLANIQGAVQSWVLSIEEYVRTLGELVAQYPDLQSTDTVDVASQP